MNSERSGSKVSSACKDSSSACSRAAISSAGATMMTLPLRRMSRPFVVMTMSSAWSQGTFCSRSVTLPCTVSLTTMLRPLKSAMSCSTARVSRSWKFSVRRSPVYSRSSSKTPGRGRGLLDGRLELEGELIVGLIRDLVVVGRRRHDEAGVLIRAQRVDGEHGRREVGDVEPTHQLLRERGVLEVDDDAAAFLANVDRRARIGKIDDDLAGAVGAAAEVDVADRAIARRGRGAGRRRLALLRGERRGGAFAGRLADQHVHAVALHARLIRHHRARDS